VAIDARAVLSKKNQNRISYSGHALNQLIFLGRNDCNLLLHLTTKHVYEHFGGQLPGCHPISLRGRSQINLIKRLQHKNFFCQRKVLCES